MPILSTNDVAPGRQFPPERERARVERMEQWARYSERRYAGLTDGNDERLRPNLYRWLSDFWRDAVIADAPVFEYEGDDRVSDLIAAMRPALIASTRLVISDMVRYGCGVYINRRAMMPQSIDPRFWYPVRAPDDNEAGKADILAYPYASGGKGAANARDTAQGSFEAGTGTQSPGSVLTDPDRMNLFADSLAVTVFDGEGGARRRQYKLRGLSVGEPIGPWEEMPAGAPAIVHVTNGEGFYGVSDFEDTSEYIGELHNRESRVSEALDRHANPHLAVPDGVMQTNASGQVVLNQNGMVIPVPDGAIVPQYVQWDASFDAQHEAMKRAFSRILALSGIAPILIDPQQRGAISSGAALRRLAIPTVNRIRSIREAVTDGLRDTIVGQAELIARSGGERFNIERDRVSLRWPAELSAGISDEADAIATLVDAGLLEQETGIQLVSKVRRSEAEDIARQHQEQAQGRGSPRPGTQRPVPDRP